LDGCILLAWILLPNGRNGEEVMEWVAVVGAAVGGTIAIVGDLIGQISARKQAARQRQEALEDARTTREQMIEDEHQKNLQEKSRQAEVNIFSLMLRSRISILDPLGTQPDQDKIIERALDMCMELSAESVCILDDELRCRLEVCSDMLDMATTPTVNFRKQRLIEVIAVVRRNIWLWLGASLRGQAIPSPTEDWIHLAAELNEDYSKPP
jgi:hypothetical protein